MSEKDVWTIAIAGVVALVALASLVKALFEYVLTNRQKRAEQFFEIRERLKATEGFRDLSQWIDVVNWPGDSDSAQESLREAPFALKRDYVGLFEEVALLMNSGLIRPSVANYMFGYYAIQCAEPEVFWENINYGSPYWTVFRSFVEKMRAQDEKLKRQEEKGKKIRRRRFSFRSW